MGDLKTPAELFNKHAKAYHDKFMDLDLYHWSFDKFCDALPSNDPKVLEIACGPGNITRYLLKKRPDLKVFGIDIAPNMVDLAKVNNPFAEFEIMDAKDIARIKEKFDGIMCGFCLPYLSKEETSKLIADASQLLNKGGILYISTMEDDNNRSGIKRSSSGDELMMYYYHADQLSEELKKSGFHILELHRQNYPEQDGSVTIDLLILASLA